MWFWIWLLGELRILAWGSERRAQSSQADGEVRRSQNLKDALKDGALWLNRSQFALYCMGRAVFLRYLMRKNSEVFNCCSAQAHRNI